MPSFACMLLPRLREMHLVRACKLDPAWLLGSDPHGAMTSTEQIPISCMAKAVHSDLIIGDTDRFSAGFSDGNADSVLHPFTRRLALDEAPGSTSCERHGCGLQKKFLSIPDEQETNHPTFKQRWSVFSSSIRRKKLTCRHVGRMALQDRSLALMVTSYGKTAE